MDRGAENYRRYLGGDDSAMVDLVGEYRDGMILFVNGYVKNLHTAEEVAEDVFFRLAVKKPRYRPSASFRTWLYTIARNEAVSRLRRDSRRRTEELDSVEQPASDGDLLVRGIIESERAVTLHRAMAGLKPEYSAVLYLTFFEELSAGETAAVMKKSRKQIGNLLYRAKTALRSALEKEGFVYEEL